MTSQHPATGMLESSSDFSMDPFVHFRGQSLGAEESNHPGRVFLMSPVALSSKSLSVCFAIHRSKWYDDEFSVHSLTEFYPDLDFKNQALSWREKAVLKQINDELQKQSVSTRDLLWRTYLAEKAWIAKATLEELGQSGKTSLSTSTARTREIFLQEVTSQYELMVELIQKAESIKRSAVDHFDQILVPLRALISHFFDRFDGQCTLFDQDRSVSLTQRQFQSLALEVGNPFFRRKVLFGDKLMDLRRLFIDTPHFAASIAHFIQCSVDGKPEIRVRAFEEYLDLVQCLTESPIKQVQRTDDRTREMYLFEPNEQQVQLHLHYFNSCERKRALEAQAKEDRNRKAIHMLHRH